MENPLLNDNSEHVEAPRAAHYVLLEHFCRLSGLDIPAQTLMGFLDGATDLTSKEAVPIWGNEGTTMNSPRNGEGYEKTE